MELKYRGAAGDKRKAPSGLDGRGNKAELEECPWKSSTLAGRVTVAGKPRGEEAFINLLPPCSQDLMGCHPPGIYAR